MYKLKKLMRKYQNQLKIKKNRKLKKSLQIYQLKVKANNPYSQNLKVKIFKKAVNLIFQINK